MIRPTSCAVLMLMMVTLAVGCGDDSDTPQPADESTATTAVETSGEAASTGESATEPATATADDASATGTDDAEFVDTRSIVEALAADDLGGRNNLTDESIATQDYLVGLLEQVADPLVLDEDGTPDFRQDFDLGTNLIAVIEGGELADEYVLVGAHYDHLGPGECDPAGDDEICNGATDNAAGVSAVLEIARSLTADGEAPRRSIILALWDAEEDGLAGSKFYVENPVVPLADTVAYVNFDIQGANLSPALASTTIMVGAETGGPPLIELAGAATETSPLDTVTLSLLFGQGRSDHASLVSGGVPSVFFTDANSPCYHTAQDDIDVVDFTKLDHQIAAAESLVRALIETDTRPVFDPAAPITSFDDAVAMHEVVSRSEPDFDRFGPEGETAVRAFLTSLDAMVSAGPEAFDAAASATLLGGSAQLVELLTIGECEGFFD